MDPSDSVREHYGNPDLEATILGALASQGVDINALRIEDLAPIDELHPGSLTATRYLLGHLKLDAASHLLDVGCGLGGAARAAATDVGCHVTGVDLTPEFIEAATALTVRLGLTDLVDFRVSPGDTLPFADATFDAAMMLHVGMNIPDKRAVFAQVRRVLRTGATFALFEQVRTGDGELAYPLPWAQTSDYSFVETAEAYAAALTAAGFVVTATEDRSAALTGPPPGALNPGVIFGPDFAVRVGNNMAAVRDGLLAPVLILAHAA